MPFGEVLRQFTLLPDERRSGRQSLEWISCNTADTENYLRGTFICAYKQKAIVSCLIFRAPEGKTGPRQGHARWALGVSEMAPIKTPALEVLAHRVQPPSEDCAATRPLLGDSRSIAWSSRLTNHDLPLMLVCDERRSRPECTLAKVSITIPGSYRSDLHFEVVVEDDEDIL